MVGEAGLRRVLAARGAVGLVLAVATAVAFGAPNRLGIFSDDWTLVPRLAWQSIDASVGYTVGLGIESHRPGLAVPFLLQAAALRIAGLGGAFVLLAVLAAVNAWLFFALVRRRLPPAWALLAALLFLLHPGDTTGTWLVTVHLRWAMLLALLACLAFCANRVWSAAALLLLAGLTYEISAFMLLLAPWFKSGGKMRDVRRSLIVTAAILVLMVLGRAACVSVPDARVGAAAELWAGKASVETYFVTFAQTLVLAVVKWPLRAVLRSLEPAWRGIWLVFLAVAALPLWRLAPALIGAPAGRLRGRRGARAVSVSCDLPTWHAIEAVAWASLGTCLGAVLSFAAAPNFVWGVASRANYFPSPGAALLLTTLLVLAHRLVSRPALRLGIGVFAAMLVSAFLVFHMSVRSEYADATRRQKAMLAQMLNTLGPLPIGTTLVLYHPEPPNLREAVSPFTARADWEARGLAYALYGPQVTGVGAWDATGLREIETSFARDGSGTPVVVYDLDHGNARWLRGSPQCCAPLVAVREPARAYVLSLRGP